MSFKSEPQQERQYDPWNELTQFVFNNPIENIEVASPPRPTLNGRENVITALRSLIVDVLETPIEGKYLNMKIAAKRRVAILLMQVGIDENSLEPIERISAMKTQTELRQLIPNDKNSTGVSASRIGQILKGARKDIQYQNAYSKNHKGFFLRPKVLEDTDD